MEGFVYEENISYFIRHYKYDMTLGKSLLYEKRQRARIYDVDGSTLSSRSYTLLKFVQFTDKNVIRTERKVKRGRARA